jgi:hypothetical protein
MRESSSARISSGITVLSISAEKKGAPQARLRLRISSSVFAVALVELAGRVEDETLDAERAVLVLRIPNGRFVELWSQHYNEQKMNRAWSSADMSAMQHGLLDQFR